MKIAFFSDCYLDLTGGITSSINAQKSALEKNGHEVFIFSTGFPRSSAELTKLARQNIFVVPSCKLFFRGLTPVSRRPKIIEKWLLREHPELKDFDAFYIHYESGCSIAALRLGKHLKIPTVQVMHGREDMGETHIIPRGFRTLVAILLNWFHSWYLPHPIKICRDDYCARSLARAKMWTLMVNHANAADLVLTPSDHFRKKLLHYGVKREIKVLPNGYPDEHFPENVTAKSLSPGEPLRIIWHSRVSAEKRMMPFLHALDLLQNHPDSLSNHPSNTVNYRQNPPKFTLDVYGGGGDFFRARRYARRHHLNVKFHGNASYNKIQPAIAKSHLDILVSYDFDTFGNTLIEAEAHGVPVFFCDPDMREIVPSGSYVLSKSPSPTDMATALADLLTHPDRIAQMSHAMLQNRSSILISHRIRILEQILHSLMKN